RMKLIVVNTRHTNENGMYQRPNGIPRVCPVHRSCDKKLTPAMSQRSVRNSLTEVEFIQVSSWPVPIPKLAVWTIVPAMTVIRPAQVGRIDAFDTRRYDLNSDGPLAKW